MDSNMEDTMKRSQLLESIVALLPRAMRRAATMLPLLAAGIVAAPALATSYAPEPEVALVVTYGGGLGIRTNKAFTDSYPYGMGMHVGGSGLPFKGDVYFGLIQPGGQQAFTWVDRDGVPKLEKGLAPIEIGMSLLQGINFNPAQNYGGDIEHVFTADDPLGMYLVFAVVVVSGKDPADSMNWLAVEMKPLFVEARP
jgi:hypothetical protein